ncbi:MULTISPECIES: SRPBCC family protein [Nocardioides]|uniref:SRPBCC family protein n=1 Tax=Nocardioides vastitatis TaxID=2568655 RepID=A0ABW0ZLC5_9ACTN|nr:SRPBCC family protein [Nocardioides sp.]THJ03313.1 cyclase [Nocardioides sp.]
MNSPEQRIRRLVTRLGWTSVALGAAPLVKPREVARAVGVDDDPRAGLVVRMVGARELLHAALLLAGPVQTVWTRVAGDALDLALLGGAARSRSGARRTRALTALALVGGITVIDVYAAARSTRRQHGGRRPGPLELRASTTINKGPDEVYAFWRDLEHLPTFMLHLQSVDDLGGNRSRWRANAPLRRRTVEWDAEITSEEPGRRITWTSLPGADVPNSGTVHFAPAPDGHGTEVKVVLHYDVPAGRLGRAVARVLGEEPTQQVRDDLRRLKQVLETGDLVRTESLPEGTDARRQAVQRPAMAEGDQR